MTNSITTEHSVISWESLPEDFQERMKPYREIMILTDLHHEHIIEIVNWTNKNTINTFVQFLSIDWNNMKILVSTQVITAYTGTNNPHVG